MYVCVYIYIYIYIYIYLFKINLSIYTSIFGCVGSPFLCAGFLQLRRAGATLCRGARASHCRGLYCCGAQALGAQAQQLWLTGLVAPQHVGSSWTGARTRVPCIGRQILNHCATREALECMYIFELWFSPGICPGVGLLGHSHVLLNCHLVLPTSWLLTEQFF